MSSKQVDPPSDVTWLQAGPPPANPPLYLAGMIILVSLAAPFLFSMAGAPSLLLAVAALALALSGIVTLTSALAAHRRRRNDWAIRRRAGLSPAGIIFHRHAAPDEPEMFTTQQIKHVALIGGALIIDTTLDHPKPGRHRLHFGKLATPRAELDAAVARINQAAKTNAPL